MNVLGFNSVIIDSSASILKDGKPVAVLEEERFTRIKHDGSFPARSIIKSLEMADISTDEIDAVCCSFQEWKAVMNRFCGFIKNGSFSGMLNSASHRKGEFLKLLRNSDNLKRALGSGKKVIRLNHHLCHAASTFFISPFERSAILVMDSTGEDTSVSLHTGKNNKITPLQQLPYAQSLGALYTSVTEYLGFKPNNSEGKVMGLAPYGSPRYYENFSEIVRFEKDGGISLDLSYFTHHTGKGVHCSDKFRKEFGPPRLRKSELTERHKDIAESLQKILERAALHIAENLRKTTNEKNLCLAGGVALNSVMNGVLLEKSGFENIFMIPAPSDAGTSLGAALYYYHQIKNKKRSFVMTSPFFGASYSENDIKNALSEYPGLNFEKRADYIETAAKLLSENQIIGWFQGRFEFGPRALGHRSILADPRKRETKDILNSRVKFRESFRPFAPAVLYEKRKEFFTNAYDNPFMLFVFPIREEKRHLVPAVTHVDGTGRGQTVSRENCPLFWKLIKEFEKITDIPVVLNTSFNVRGEPIVNSPEDALECYVKTGMDYLFLHDYIVWKKDRKKP